MPSLKNSDKLSSKEQSSSAWISKRSFIFHFRCLFPSRHEAVRHKKMENKINSWCVSFYLVEFWVIKIVAVFFKTEQIQMILVKFIKILIQFNEQMLINFMNHNQKFKENWKKYQNYPTKKFTKKFTSSNNSMNIHDDMLQNYFF